MSGFTSATLEPSFSKAFANVAREARLDRGFQVGVALAHDLLHGRRLHAGLLQLRERLACIHRVELLRIAHQHDPGKAQGVGDPQEVAGLDRGGEGSLVHHQHGLPISRPHLPLALLRQPSLGDPCIVRKEALQGLALDPGLRLQGPGRRGRGREAFDLVAALLQERAGAVQHGGLAGPGIALHADNAVLFREDQLDRVPLALRQRSLSEGLVHGPGAHRDRFPSLAGLHQGNRFPLVGHGLARGEHVLCPWQARGMERSGLLQPAHFPFRLRHGHRAGVPGERAGEKIGAGEHRLALGEMRHGPFHGFPGQPPVPRRLASRTGAFPAGVPRYGALGHRFGRKGLRVEPEMPAACFSQIPRSAALSTSRLRARVMSAARWARRWSFAGVSMPRSAMAASISARRVENASITSRGTPAISNRPSAWVFSIP